MNTKTPDYTESYSQIGEVRFYNEGGRWRYIHAGGEGTGFPSLESAQAEVKQFIGVEHGRASCSVTSDGQVINGKSLRQTGGSE